MSLKKIWAGSKDGKLSLFDAKTFECEKSFDAHTDSIRSLCYVEVNKYLFIISFAIMGIFHQSMLIFDLLDFERFVISGSGSKDGTIAVWRASRLTKRTIMKSIKKMMAMDGEN